MAASTGSVRVIGAETDGGIGGEPDESFSQGNAKAAGDAAASPASDASPHDERYLFHQVARVMPFMLWVCRPNGETHYISPQWVTYTGAPLDLHLGHGWFDFLHPDDRAPALEAWRKAVANVTTFRAEFRVRSAGGGYRWFESISVPVRDRAGAVVRWMGSTSDVHDARETRRALLEERDRFLRLAETVPGAVHAYRVRPDRSTSFPFATAAIESIYGVSREALAANAQIGAENIHPDDVPHVRAAVEESERNLTPFRCEWRMLHPQRGEIWVEGHSVPAREPDGGTIWYGVIVEVTERKRAEEAQRRSQRLEALGRLAGGIAHDFNNILLAITGNARLALAELPPDTAADSPLRASVLEIEKASARAADLVHRILAFSRQNEPKREVLALRQPVEEALQLLRATLPAMIEIRTRFFEEAPAVRADSTQIHQIVMNLVTNAAYAIGMRAGRIDIAVDCCPAPAKSAASDDVAPGPYACLTVTDDGAGMDRATLERIFDPFFTTKPAGQGTGLGLSVVHGIVRSHQGTVVVESEPGKGSTFRVYFPAAIEPAPAESSTAVSAPRGAGQRVLYVDDEEALVYLTSRVLERMGYEVRGFSDPVAALEAFRENPAGFDVVVTDLSMPGMSGFHFARALLQVRPDVSVLMTSGYVRPEDREEARALGVRELILKPDTIDELGLALERVLKQTAQALSA